jgi:hypothetical protein
MSKRELTEEHKKFVEVFLETRGDTVKAAEAAGLSRSQGYYLRKALKDEIIDAAKEELAFGAPAAVATLIDALKPDGPVHRDRLEAAKQILDRTGIVKEEKQQIEIKHGIFILPSKDNA